MLTSLKAKPTTFYFSLNFLHFLSSRQTPSYDGEDRGFGRGLFYFIPNTDNNKTPRYRRGLSFKKIILRSDRNARYLAPRSSGRRHKE